MMPNLLKSRIWLWALSGFLLAIAFLHNDLWWLFIPGLFLLLRLLVTTTNNKDLIAGTLLVVLFKSLGALSWILTTYPIYWLGIESKTVQWLIIIFYWFNMSVGLALGGAVALVCFALVVRRLPIVVYAFPFVWVLSELLGSLSFSIYSLGPGVLPNVYFSFGYIGYLLAELNALTAVAGLFGVYGLSFLAALATFLVWEFRQFFALKDKKHYPLVLTVVFLGLILVCNFYYQPVESTVSKKVIAVDSSFNNRYFSNQTAARIKNLELRKAVAAALKYQPDLVVLPEDSRLSRGFESESHALELLSSLSKSSTTVVVDSSRVETSSGSSVLRAFYYDLEKQSVYYSDKQYLVPQGEFLPYFTVAFLKLAGQKNLLAEFRKNQNYISGPFNDYSPLPGNLPSVLFCTEVVSPVRIKQITGEHQNKLFLNPSSHAWFNNPVTLLHQLDDMLRVQAIWNGVTIIQAGNQVEGKAYLPDGSQRSGKKLDSSENWQLIMYNL